MTPRDTDADAFALMIGERIAAELGPDPLPIVISGADRRRLLAAITRSMQVMARAEDATRVWGVRRQLAEVRAELSAAVLPIADSGEVAP